MIAVFLGLRLRALLGRRHGEERQRPNPFSSVSSGEAGGIPVSGQSNTNVVALVPRGGEHLPAERDSAHTQARALIGLSHIHAADPTFSEQHFVEGVRAAFEMIVHAFARGDLAGLRPLLSDPVYSRFAAAIDYRHEQKQVQETTILEFGDITIIDAKVEGRFASVTVRVETRQVGSLRDSQGVVIEGDPSVAVDVVDVWTFERVTRQDDPNWLLAETATA